MGFYSNFSDFFMSLLVTGVVMAFLAAKLFRTWKAMRPMNRASFFDLSGISTIAMNHIFSRQLRGNGHSQLRKMAGSSQSLRNISAYLPYCPGDH